MAGLNDFLGSLPQNPQQVGGMGGVTKMGKTMVGMVVFFLEHVILAMFGVSSEEGKTILKVIKDLSRISSGVQPSDIQSVVMSLLSALPANMQGGNPLQGIGGAPAMGVAPPPAGMPPAGAGTPPMPPPPQGGGAPQGTAPDLKSLLGGG